MYSEENRGSRHGCDLELYRLAVKERPTISERSVVAPAPANDLTRYAPRADPTAGALELHRIVQGRYWRRRSSQLLAFVERIPRPRLCLDAQHSASARERADAVIALCEVDNIIQPWHLCHDRVGGLSFSAQPGTGPVHSTPAFVVSAPGSLRLQEPGRSLERQRERCRRGSTRQRVAG